MVQARVLRPERDQLALGPRAVLRCGLLLPLLCLELLLELGRLIILNCNLHPDVLRLRRRDAPRRRASAHRALHAERLDVLLLLPHLHQELLLLVEDRLALLETLKVLWRPPHELHVEVVELRTRDTAEGEHHVAPLLAQDQCAQGRERLPLHVVVVHLDDDVVDADHPRAVRGAPRDDVGDVDLACLRLLLEEDAHTRHLRAA
mmetsp:Transcript_5831/g.14074  ORF Transcript_5831/g.14074 Transcript_5831/m.14074 type:complete len:204 (+) Transcript_5831:386-997(+)